MEKFNVKDYFELDETYSNDSWTSWSINSSGLKEIDKAIHSIKDYAYNRIREQASAYGYPYDVNLWVKDWSGELGEDVEDLVIPTKLEHTKITFSELVNECECPIIKVDWTTFISEDDMYDFGRWFRNRHEIPIIDVFYKPFGRFDKRIESVIYSMEMGDYSRSINNEERLEIANKRLEENNDN
tara:strand:- start:69 stop:620 length:552 start_codon:yes stop_codon:yes gene_type:complete